MTKQYGPDVANEQDRIDSIAGLDSAQAEPVSVVKRRKGFGSRRVPTPIMIIAFVLVAGIGYVAGIASAGPLNSRITGLLMGGELDLSSVQETYRKLVDNFDGDLDRSLLIEGANRGLVEAVGDPYTVFMNSKESTAFDDSLSGNIGGGIGVEVGMRNDAPTVVRVLQNNSAEKAGVRTGDIINEVNGESTKGKVLGEVTSKIRGEVGTTVKLLIYRDGQNQEFNITRAQVNNPSAYGEVKDGVGILTITRFDEDTGGLTRAVASDFKKQAVKGVILDLRGNGGGFVSAAQAVAGVWLDRQVVLSERSSGKVVDELKSTGSPILNGVPTVVLVNESSASASEIIAGAFADHKVAKVVGETTFGKGSVQKLMNLDGGATLKVTVARWYTPGGINISERGITPTVTVSRTSDDINAGRDPQLDAALKAF